MDFKSLVNNLKKPIQQGAFQRKGEKEEETRRKAEFEQKKEEEEKDKKMKEKLKKLEKEYKGDEIKDMDEMLQNKIVKKVKIEWQQNQGKIDFQNQFIDEEGVPPLEKQDVILKLRELSQPVTYFGETNWQRYKRLLLCQENKEEQEKSRTGDIQLNRLLKMKDEEFKKYITPDQLKYDDKYIEILDKTNLEKIWGHEQKREKRDEIVAEKVDFAERNLTTLAWIKKMLNQWEKILENLFPTEVSRQTPQGKAAIAVFRQCIEQVKPLSHLLQEKKCTEEILVNLYQIAYFCQHKEYIRAHDKYLELAIGNAPWPMGVTMVGIHERTGRSKISNSQIAHILNDETQRKYLSSVKRLITFAQKVYPNDLPSKMVNFTGSANQLF